MSTTIDAGGRVVIPRHIRETLGLGAGARVEVVLRDGEVLLVPEPAPIRVERRDGRSIAVVDGEMPALTAEAVRDTLEGTRR